MPLLSSFRTWLDLRQYSSSTVRNYLLDVSRYLQYLGKSSTIEADLSDNEIPIVFSIDNLNAYITQLSTNTNYQRYLASLNLFCQFAIDQNIINTNPIIRIRKNSKGSKPVNPLTSLRRIRSEFAIHLAKHNHSPVTIKNYINDIDQYINWLETNPLGTQ